MRNEAESRFLVADQLVLDCTDRRAWLDSTKLDLGAKALALLEELMRHPEMLVTKERLFDVGWPDQAVSDAVLTTAIRELRRALGDSARTPEWIETHHGQGYRFLKPVKTRAVHPGRGSQTAAEEKETPVRAFTPRSWAIIAGALLALLAVSSIVYILVPADEVPQSSGQGEIRGVAVLPFAVEGGDDWIGSAMANRLTSVLSNAPGLFVADNQLVAAMTESENPWDAARADKIGVIVTGQVRVLAGRIDVDVKILDPEGREIWARRLSDNEDAMIGLTERVAIETARALKIAADPRQTAEMANVGTRSIAAFEQYSRAIQILDSIEGFRKPDRIPEALDHLRQAVAIDPTFAKAAASLSWFEFPRAYAENAAQAEARALTLAEIANVNAVEDGDRELGEATVALRKLRFVEARQKLEELYAKTRLTSAPTNHSILLQLSYIAAATRDHELGEQVWRDLTDYNLARGRIQFSSPHLISHSKPLLLRYVDNLAQQEPTPIGAFNSHTALLLAGETARARAQLEVGDNAENPPAHILMQIGQACAEGKTAEARALARNTLGSAPRASWMNWSIAQTAGLMSFVNKLRPPARDDASQRALLTMMGEPGFDPAPYPLLLAALEQAGVSPEPVARASYYCPIG